MREKEDNCTLNILLLEQVKSKLTGEAQDVLLNSKCNRWGEIKKTLTQRFGDPRSEELLLHDLTTTFQNYNETYESFHEKIKQKLQTLLEHVSVREVNSDLKELFMNQNNIITHIGCIRVGRLRALSDIKGRFHRSTWCYESLIRSVK
ncbi:hypothetical protein WA026_016277 [Henosepilachna vigintioctopunctata]|uniref:Uncharacterized protein n=1 Tax=Henosepilachna vigintioctopunctata TaxID=420089 RepID=A0AAW1UN15_9CUCU